MKRKLLASALVLAAAAAPGAFSAEPATGAGIGTGRAACRSAEEHDRKIFAAVAPAVVGITCRTKPEQGYFGTGVVVSADGLILTSTTVVPAGARDIRVFFPGTREEKAEIVGLDNDTEAALIRVRAEKLAHVPLAPSAGARPGQLAYTFGNPFGTLMSDDNVSFSRGYVSGVYRLADNGDYQSVYRDLVIETEAAVNPGSDGGPLVDGQGRLLGIISLGFSGRRWLGCAVPVHLSRAKFEALAAMQPPDRHLELPEPLRLSEDAWGAVLDKAAPAVVQIAVPRNIKSNPWPAGMSHAQMQAETARRYRLRPAGPVSGVLVSPEGHVVTSWYNLSGLSDQDRGNVRVRLSDGRELPARILGFDRGVDVAMLKVEGEGLPHLKLAAGVNLAVGEPLAVIGRSEDPAVPTVNRGLVSARSRGHRGVAQISAYLNYGNSGGAVVDAGGRLLGIASQVSHESTWGLNSGIGFVTLSGTIQAMYDDLAAGREIKPPPRTFLGVAPGIDDPTVLGAAVGRVLPGSAADQATLRADDLIVEVDGRPVESWPGLVRNILDRKPGDRITLTVQRAGEKLQLETRLGASQ